MGLHRNNHLNILDQMVEIVGHTWPVHMSVADHVFLDFHMGV